MEKRGRWSGWGREGVGGHWRDVMAAVAEMKGGERTHEVKGC